jgi:hypothetical protein
VIPNPSPGVWKVFVQTKLLSEAQTQHYALVITSSVGTDILEPTNATQLPEIILDQCYPGSPLNPFTDSSSSFKALVDLSIFNFWSSLTSIVKGGVIITSKGLSEDSMDMDPIYSLFERHQVFDTGRYE